MFNRTPSPDGHARTVRITFDGQPLQAREGDSLAAALLASGISTCRTTPVSGSARGPYCLMGVCFECLVVVDGRPNQQACMIPAREGMRVETQLGARTLPDGVEAGQS
jgi:predicted molibdopterin-dependent oxidoreductase YjgC